MELEPFGTRSLRLAASRSHGDPVVVAFAGELDSETVLTVVRAIGAVLADQLPSNTIIVDLTALTVLSAPGLRVLHSAVDHAAEDGITARIVTGANRLVERALHIGGLDRVLNVYADRTSALRIDERTAFLTAAEHMWNR